MNTAYPGEQQLVFWREHLKAQSYVYVMQDPYEKLFKVGYSVDPFYRQAQLRKTWDGLKIRCVIPGPMKLEKLLHKRGKEAKAWTRGDEWFSIQGSGQLFLLFLDALAEAMQEAYDGSGEAPPLPAFDSTRTPEQIREFHLSIEKEILRSGERFLVYWAMENDISDIEIATELYRMEESGRYRCFFEDADFARRGPLAKKSVKLGYHHRFGRPQAA